MILRSGRAPTVGGKKFRHARGMCILVSNEGDMHGESVSCVISCVSNEGARPSVCLQRRKPSAQPAARPRRPATSRHQPRLPRPPTAAGHPSSRCAAVIRQPPTSAATTAAPPSSSARSMIGETRCACSWLIASHMAALPCSLLAACHSAPMLKHRTLRYHICCPA